MMDKLNKRNIKHDAPARPLLFVCMTLLQQNNKTDDYYSDNKIYILEEFKHRNR